MKWAAVVVLGFGLEIGAVIWLARSNTARWERDHRAARAVMRAREEASLRLRAAAAVAQHVPPGTRRLPHPHLAQLPHVHLPPWVVDRVAHARGTLHRPLLHLPLLHLTRRRPDAQEEPVPAPDDAGTPSEEQPAS